MKYISDKDRRSFCAALKAPTEEKVLDALDRITEKGREKSTYHEYPQSELGTIYPIFKFSTTVRKVIYTTNAIESPSHLP